jgi:hypothetical protein
MKIPKKIKGLVFYLFLIFSIFGVFLLFIIWNVYYRPQVPNPPGQNYQIRNQISDVFPDALYYDFEKPQPDGSIFSNIGRSGFSSLIAPGPRGYSSIINIPTGNWGAEKLKHIALTAWLKINDTGLVPDAKLALVITNPLNDVLFARFISINSEINNLEWFRVSNSFETTSYTYHSDDRIKIYLWNAGSGDIFLDDLTVFFGNQFIPGAGNNISFYNRESQSKSNNRPPYPPIFLYKNEIGNDDQPGLSKSVDKKSIPLNGDGLLLAGNFIHPKGLPQEILSLMHEKVTVYWFLKNEKHFAVSEKEYSGLSKENLKKENVFSGDFDGDHFDEIVISIDKSDSIYMLKAKVNSGNFSLDIKKYILPVNAGQKPKIALGDNKGGKSLLLCVSDDGLYQLVTFSINKWIVDFNVSAPVKEWNSKKFIYHLFSVKGKKGQDNILTVFRNLDNNRTCYILLEAIVKNRELNFQQVFLKNYGQGLFTGTDTISMDDEFFCSDFLQSPEPELLRFRSDWRYDLKLLTLNDSAYNILGNIDFKGYSADYNPKYQEVFTVLPGNYFDANKTDLLVIGTHKNGQNNKDFFPSIVQIYSYKTEH